MSTENEKLREALVRVSAALAAAISLLDRTPQARQAAPSDTIFQIMLADYSTALDHARKLLLTPQSLCEMHEKPDGRWGCLRCDRSWEIQPAHCARKGEGD
jgi:hypothetical protein